MLIDIAYASETVAQTTEQGAQDSGVLASLGINGTMFVFQLINFAIVALILWFLVLKPLTKKMSERQSLIDEGLKNAEEVKKNLHKSEQKYQERVDEAKSEAGKIIAKTQVDAAGVASNMKEKAKQEIELLVDQAKRNIKIEKQEMMSEVKKEAANLVAMALEKILSEKIDGKKDKGLIDESLKKIKL